MNNAHSAKLLPCRVLSDEFFRALLGKELWYLPETIFEYEGIYWINAINEKTEMVAVPLSCLQLSKKQVEELKESHHLSDSAFKNSLLTKDYYVPASLRIEA